MDLFLIDQQKEKKWGGAARYLAAPKMKRSILISVKITTSQHWKNALLWHAFVVAAHALGEAERASQVEK